MSDLNPGFNVVGHDFGYQGAKRFLQ